MYIPDALKKFNDFIDVAIPSNKSYFSRLGEVKIPSTQYTGEEVAQMNQDKISEIEAYAEYAEKMSEESKESEK